MASFAVLILLLLAALVAWPVIAEWRRPVMDDTARQDAEGRFVTLSQGVTHYDWIGPLRGPVAVCVHGLTTPSFVWRGLARGLAGLGYRVLVYDLYGRGYSDRPGGMQDGAFFSRQLAELLAHEGVEDDITLIGYSMGGAIATDFAARSPDRIRQLILLAPAGTRSLKQGFDRRVAELPVIGDWMMRARFPRLHRRGVEAERGLPSSVDRIQDRQIEELRWRGFTPAVLASLRGILSAPLEAEHRAVAEAGIPVLAIWGEEDVVVPASGAGQLALWNREARQDVIPGAGHGLTYTHTDAVLASITDARRP